ncbi:helix-turn-helix transcriptional regulator [Neobacillus mesonae]|uniref:helix-turn-helix domain-containing protein n=1 Tax=Neobacillus mesonae TaxID=1193713 RepID=UPI002E2030B5|nr:helix-turn-helix transcriptional regulator [Neobacillus mesonae]
MKQPISLHIPEVIKALRKTLKLTQEELAERTGLNRTYISLLERGERNPSFDTVVFLAKGFRMELSEFVKAIEEHPENCWLKGLLETESPEY